MRFDNSFHRDNSARRSRIICSSSACTATNIFSFAARENTACKLSSSSMTRLPVLQPIKTLMPMTAVLHQEFPVNVVYLRQKIIHNAMEYQLLAIVSSISAFFSFSKFAVIVGGLVFGISNTIVQPPRIAAFAPVRQSSLYSMPGVRKCTCGSITAGNAVKPSAGNNLIFVD